MYFIRHLLPATFPGTRLFKYNLITHKELHLYIFRKTRNQFCSKSNSLLSYFNTFADLNERKTISQYLEEDLHETYSPKSTQATLNQSRVAGRRSRGRRLSLDPTTKIKVEKLEVVSLLYLLLLVISVLQFTAGNVTHLKLSRAFRVCVELIKNNIYDIED